VGNLTGELATFPVIGLDTSIFIYHFEAHPIYIPITREILAGIEKGQWEAVTSVITLMEISVRPLQLNRRDVAQKYEALLVNFPHLRIVEINRDITRNAALLRAEYKIHPADALQIASVMSQGGKVFITNDRQLKRAEEHLKIILLEDYI